MTARYRGFTVIEVMIAIAIVALLAAVALPSYRDYILRGKLVDAHTALADFRVRQEQFYQDNRRYDNGGGNCGAASPTSKYFTFGCVPDATTPSQTYTATATGKAGEGADGFAFTINQNNDRTTTVTAPASSNGWSSHSPNDCWVRAKAGTC